MYNWGIRAIGVPNKSTKQTGDFWIYLIIYSMQVVIVSAWNPSQDPTGPLVVPHRKTGSPTSLGITFSHWHNSRKSDSNPKVKQHSLKYSQYTNLESIIINSLYNAFMRNSKNLGQMLHMQGHQSSSGTGHNSEQVPYMHYSESSRSQSRLWTNLVSIPTMLPTIWISVKKHSQIAIKINTPANNLEQIKVIKLTAEKD